MEKPDLQDIRDACADLSRSEEEGDDFSNDKDELEDELEGEHDTINAKPLFKRKPGSLPPAWKPEREKELDTMKELDGGLPNMIKEDEGTVIDFGVIDDEAKFRRKKMVVKVCGHKIHNYRSERAMSHTGWFHFSIIAKDSNLFDAIKLCRH